MLNYILHNIRRVLYDTPRKYWLRDKTIGWVNHIFLRAGVDKQLQFWYKVRECDIYIDGNTGVSEVWCNRIIDIAIEYSELGYKTENLITIATKTRWCVQNQARRSYVKQLDSLVSEIYSELVDIGVQIRTNIKVPVPGDSNYGSVSICVSKESDNVYVEILADNKVVAHYTEWPENSICKRYNHGSWAEHIYNFYKELKMDEVIIQDAKFEDIGY